MAALEAHLKTRLLHRTTRHLALTEAGVVAMRQAEHIFQLGEALPDQVRSAAQAPAVRLNVGIADGLPKGEVVRLLQPVLATPDLRLVCQEGDMADLLAELAVHRLDVVLADHPAPFHPDFKVYSEPLGESGMGWYGTPDVAQRARAGFPASLAEVPILMLTAHSTVRNRMDHWLAQQGLSPRVVGEFEDNALLEAFGSTGLGVFPAAVAAQADLLARCGVQLIGACDGVDEHYFAIHTERKVSHPLVKTLLQRA